MIIADMTFGFWVALFDHNHYRILHGTPICIFRNLPPGANRQLVHNTLTKIRSFRNRIYHNEHILFETDDSGNSNFDLSKVREVYECIQKIFDWLNLDFDKWTIRINNIPFEIKRTDYVMSHYPTKKYYLHRLTLDIKHFVQKYVDKTFKGFPKSV